MILISTSKLILSAIAAGVMLAISAPVAVAEQTVPNPLRPRTGDARPTTESRKAESNKPETDKPKRQRSEKQKQNDEMMRACGQEWRAQKASLQAKGETWRSFLKDCRAKKKPETRA